MSEEQYPPPDVYLDTTYVGGQPPPGKNVSRTTQRPNGHSGQFGIQPGHVRIGRNLQSTITTLAEEYQNRSNQLPQTIENELAATRLEGPTNPVPPIEGIIRELGVVTRLWGRKVAEFNNKTAVANSFYGYDPIDRPLAEFLPRAKTIELPVRSNGAAMQAWNTSYRAAHDARLLSQTINSLSQRSIDLQQTLAVVQAAEQARVAAEQEAQRVAAEQARIRAEAEALAHAQEQARLAALAEAERVAAEQARIAAEAAAQYIAAERARLEAQAEVQRQTEQLLLENQRQAEEQALREAMQALNAAKANRPFPVSGAAAASGPVLTIPAGAVALETATSLAIRTALRSAAVAVLTASAAAIGIASGVVILAGVAALVYHALRDNKEPYALSVPLSDLTTYDAGGLYAIAEVNGEIELSVALGSKTTENTTEFVVAATNGTTVPSKIPVRLATYDPALNVYKANHPTAPGMTWTPIAKPGNASTALPAQEPNIVPYDGTNLTALEGRIDTSPAVDLYRFRGFIYVFPTESGIPPQYVVLNSPYDGATTKGEHSGREFDPEQTGGPTMELEWRSAITSLEGVELVKLHTSRFPPSDANKVMIERLERILSGELEITDTDKRFYTHEIREFERIRALGYTDTEALDENSPIWNNVHTATLEDYKLKDDETLLYTTEALAAADEQDQRYYQKLLKEIW